MSPKTITGEELDLDDAPAREADLFLVDGNNLAYRAYFALPEELVTSDGFPTNALLGFTNMLVKLLSDYRPRGVAVAWDTKPVHRTAISGEYKSDRRPMPDLLREQFPYFKPIVEAFGYRNLEFEGWEADDVIATLATRADEAGVPTCVVSTDRDAFQLVTDNVCLMMTPRGVADVHVYTPERVTARLGVPPEKVPDLIGLKGDTSDSIAGVPGIGDKTAAQLIQQFDSVEGVLEHVDELSPGTREVAPRARRPGTRVEGPGDDAPRPRHRLRPDGARARAARPLRAAGDVPAVRVPGAHAADRPAGRGSARGRRPRRPGEELPLARRRASRDGRQRSVTPSTTVGARLRSPTRSSSRRGRSTSRARSSSMTRSRSGSWRSTTRSSRRTSSSLGARPTISPISPPSTASRSIRRRPPRRRPRPSSAARRCPCDSLRSMRARLEERDLVPLYEGIELPLTSVLARMEDAGVHIDTYRMGEITARLRERVDELEGRAYELAGEEFMLGSTQQVAHVLFEQLGLTPGRKGKTGYSTDTRVLQTIRDEHEIVPVIEEWRELTKLVNTYLGPLPEMIGEDGRLHTTINQAVAATGRLSTSNPNLQAIPIRTELGREIRSAFVAEEGSRLVSADYSQIELRILAHVSDEPKLKAAFAAGEDIHSATAAEVLGTEPSALTKDERAIAKMINFGIVYGISAHGLSQNLQIPRDEAQTYIDTYLARFPHVQDFIARTIEKAKRDGYVTSLLGRRRPVPEIRTSSWQTRALGERLAVNFVMQGSNADIIKVAMIGIDRRLRDEGRSARLVLQVHDELLLEAPEAEVRDVRAIVQEEMCGAYDLDPPLAVDVGVGENWAEAKD